MNGNKSEEIMCNIDAIIAKKMEKLAGYGLQMAFGILEDTYRFKETFASQISIFDKMAELSRIINASETKGKQVRFDV